MEVRTSLYRGIPITHALVDGIGLFEGDIILGTESELRPADRKTQGRSAVAISGTSYRWPGGTMPYVIDAAIPNVARVQSAISHWNTKLPGSIKMIRAQPRRTM